MSKALWEEARELSTLLPDKVIRMKLINARVKIVEKHFLSSIVSPNHIPLET